MRLGSSGNTCPRPAGGTSPQDAPPTACQRRDVLRLTLEDYQEQSNRAVEGLKRAVKFLYVQKVFAAADVPYQTQLVPLAAALALLGNQAESAGTQQKVARWYWCGVFGELYGSAVESRFARDVNEMMGWLNGGPEPNTVTEAVFSPGRLRTLRTRLSAAYKGLHALLLRDSAADWISGSPIEANSYFDEAIDIHHIFPQHWCEEQKIPRAVYDSACLINKTPLSARTNRIIGGVAPSVYLPKVEARAEVAPSRMDEVLKTHAVDPALLRSNDFAAFMESRATALLQRIAAAKGLTIAAVSVEEPLEDFMPDGNPRATPNPFATETRTVFRGLEPGGRLVSPALCRGHVGQLDWRSGLPNP